MTKSLFTVCLLGYAVLFSTACAQPLSFSTESPAIWLEPHLDGLAMLREDERVVYWNGAVEVLASGVAGDSVLSCADSLFGVAKDAGLLNISTGQRGLKVALHGRPVCIEDSLVVLSETADELLRVSYDLEVLARAPVNALPDAELITSDLTGDGRLELIVLTDPTTRYAHAVLGDNIEAASVSVFDADTLELLTTYTLPEPFVFEQRRVLPYAFEDSSGVRQGFLATRASAETGAAVVLLVLGERLELVAEAAAIGTGFRWLNLFVSRDGVAYAVRTPHIGGPLQRYQFEDNATEARLATEHFQLGVTNHKYGARNLDLAVLLDREQATLAVALRSHDGVRMIHCAIRCEAGDTFTADAQLSSNVTQLVRDAKRYIAFADVIGNVYIMPTD